MMESPKKLQEEAGLNRTPLGQIPIMVYELGDLAKALTYMEVHPSGVAGAYLGEAKIALADLICQCFIMVEHISPKARQGHLFFAPDDMEPFVVLLELGLERQAERMAEVKEWLHGNANSKD